jgi:hypothetical protein
MVAWMLVSLSQSGQPTDVTFYRRKPILNVKVDKELGVAVLSGLGARRLAEWLNTCIEFSDGTEARLAEIWTINPMPQNGLSQAELDVVDLAKGEDRIGPGGETLRQMIRETYQCRDRALCGSHAPSGRNFLFRDFEQFVVGAATGTRLSAGSYADTPAGKTALRFPRHGLLIPYTDRTWDLNLG